MRHACGRQRQPSGAGAGARPCAARDTSAERDWCRRRRHPSTASRARQPHRHHTQHSHGHAARPAAQAPHGALAAAPGAGPSRKSIGISAAIHPHGTTPILNSSRPVPIFTCPGAVLRAAVAVAFESARAQSPRRRCFVLRALRAPPAATSRLRLPRALSPVSYRYFQEHTPSSWP